MNGELAQLIAVASHARAALGGDVGALAAVAPDGDRFRWVADTRFVAPDGTEAVDAAGWVGGLRTRGVEALAVVIPAPGSQTKGGITLDDRMVAGFANAGTAYAVAHGPGIAEAWSAGWALGDRQREDQRIWSVAYHGIALDGVPTLAVTPLDGATAALEAVLRRAADFARATPYLEHWADVFEGALAAEGDPIGLLPPAAPAAARRLIGMAASAWVFGGMGSWNDIGFASDDPAAAGYAAISADLYASVLAALGAAANA